MEKLTWEEIRKRYDGEWVKLVDYVWEEDQPYPAEGVVLVHARTRREFNELALRHPTADCARLFVGDVVHCTGFRPGQGERRR
jgi:hypothetical protein